MSATESLASVDTICVDKTGTLTDGDLTVVGIESRPTSPTPSWPHRELGRYAASAGDRNRTLEAIGEEFPGEAEPVVGEVAFSSEWKWSALTFDGPDGRRQPGARRARPDDRLRSADPRSADWPTGCEEETRGRPPGRRPQPDHAHRCRRAEPTATRRASSRSPWWCSRENLRPGVDGDPRADAQRGSRPEADLRRRPGDGDRGRRARSASPTDAGVIEG